MNETDLISEWLEIAKNDYIAAQHLYEDIRPRQIEISSYHCQQSVEKTLKAFLISKETEPPYTHNLEDLCRRCEDLDDGFSVFSDACLKLSPYATATRYPIRADITEEEAIFAIEKAREIYEYVCGLIPDVDRSLRIDVQPADRQLKNNRGIERPFAAISYYDLILMENDQEPSINGLDKIEWSSIDQFTEE